MLSWIIIYYWAYGIIIDNIFFFFVMGRSFSSSPFRLPNEAEIV